jgi:hypothetical protein
MTWIEPQCILSPLDRLFHPAGEEMRDGAAGKPEEHSGIARAQPSRPFEHLERPARIATQRMVKPVAAADPH